MRWWWTGFVFLATAGPAAAQSEGADTEADPDVIADAEPAAVRGLRETSDAYRIRVRVEPEARTLSGTVEIDWTNPADQPLEALVVHLYLNAFAHDATTWFSSAGGRAPDMERMERIFDDPWGWLEVTRVNQSEPGRLLPCDLDHIQPDDGNPLDRSLASVKLPRPLGPGEAITLSLDFEAQLPRPIARVGATQGYLHVAQWYPKIGVYDRQRERWAARQFHGTTEFFADFANYSVTIDAPEAYDIIATGEGEKIDGGDEGRQLWSFSQPSVIDFAFVAAVGMTKLIRTYAPSISDNEIEITYAMPIDAEGLKFRMREAAETTFELMAQWVGDYPFSTMKIIAPPWRAAATAGMEYPTLVTVMPGDLLFESDVLRNVRLFEEVVVHEIIHNYFQGVVANDEQRQAFLDEGFTTYWTWRVLEEMGRGRPGWEQALGYPIDELQMKTLRMARVHEHIAEPMVRRPAASFHPGTHREQIYTRSLLIFTTAERLFGRDAVDAVFASYFGRWRFQHPEAEDFLAVANEVGPETLAEFLREALFAPTLPDFRVESVTVAPYRPPLGHIRIEDRVVRIDDPADSEKGRVAVDPRALETSEVFVIIEDPGFVGPGGEREGEMERRALSAKMTAPDQGFEADPEALYTSKVILAGGGWQTLPVDVRFIFADGATTTDVWDGRSAWRGYRFVRFAPLVSVEIDPLDRITLDPIPTNDGWKDEPDRTLADGIGTWIARIGQWLLAAVVGGL